MEGDDALFVSCFWGAGLISENSIANGLISGQKLTSLRSAIKNLWIRCKMLRAFYYLREGSA